MEDIDPFLCTHLAFGFAGLDKSSFQIKVLDPYNELDEDYGKGAYRRFNNLKLFNPNLKTLLSVGGWNEGASSYSKMAADPEKRQKFISSSLQILNKYQFDGLDFDWEYPGGRADSPGDPDNDKSNYITLLRELRAAFDQNEDGQRPLLLTAAVSAGVSVVDKGYDVASMSGLLDFINVMSYDFHGWFPGHTFTGHNSPLFATPEEEADPDHPGHNRNTDFAIRYWIQNGADPSKLLMGMAAYGRGFLLADPRADHGLYAPATGPIDPGMYTSQAGFWGYNEYCEKMKTEMEDWQMFRDHHVVAPYVVKGDKWFGFDDEESIARKCDYVKEKGLGGAMIWSIDTDDFNGFCGRKFGLLAAMADALNGGPQTPPPGWTTPSANATTTTTTTPSSSSTSSSHDDVIPDEICGVSAGIKADLADCSKYYLCTLNADGSSWHKVHVACPKALLFNPLKLVCDWPANVKCANETTNQNTVLQLQIDNHSSHASYVTSTIFLKPIALLYVFAAATSAQNQ